MKGFDVYQNGCWRETVYSTPNKTAEQVKYELVKEEGYPARINVVPVPKRHAPVKHYRTAYA